MGSCSNKGELYGSGSFLDPSWSPKRFLTGQNVNIEIVFSLTSHLTCRKQLEYLCRRMSRETVSYDMWWLQAGPSSPATYVMGRRVGMDETQQVKMHFNWDNLSPSSLLSSLLSSPLLSLGHPINFDRVVCQITTAFAQPRLSQPLYFFFAFCFSVSPKATPRLVGHQVRFLGVAYHITAVPHQFGPQCQTLLAILFGFEHPLTFAIAAALIISFHVLATVLAPAW